MQQTSGRRKYSRAHMLQWDSYVEKFQLLFIGEDAQRDMILYNSQ